MLLYERENTLVLRAYFCWGRTQAWSGWFSKFLGNFGNGEIHSQSFRTKNHIEANFRLKVFLTVNLKFTQNFLTKSYSVIFTNCLSLLATKHNIRKTAIYDIRHEMLYYRCILIFNKAVYLISFFFINFINHFFFYQLYNTSCPYVVALFYVVCLYVCALKSCFTENISFPCI